MYFQIKRKPPLTVYIWLSNTIPYWNALKISKQLLKEGSATLK